MSVPCRFLSRACSGHGAPFAGFTRSVPDAVNGRLDRACWSWLGRGWDGTRPGGQAGVRRTRALTRVDAPLGRTSCQMSQVAKRPRMSDAERYQAVTAARERFLA